MLEIMGPYTGSLARCHLALASLGETLELPCVHASPIERGDWAEARVVGRDGSDVTEGLTHPAIQLIKAGSSKWCNQNFAHAGFEWQAGYSAFSVSASLLAKTQEYIRNQRQHHRKRDFAEEWKEFLEKNGFGAPA